MEGKQRKSRKDKVLMAFCIGTDVSMKDFDNDNK